MSEPLLLIDGDQFIYKTTAALERETRWDDQNHVLYSNAEECWENLKGMLSRVFERFESERHALCFTQSPNFRHDVDPTYKSARRGVRKPLCYAALRERVEGTYNCLALPGLEADDIMGILATKPGSQDRIIVSQDKDMKQIPGCVWDGENLHSVSEQAADYFHMYQTLVGDTSDGYPGCPGIGPVKAEKLLNVRETYPEGEDPTPYQRARMWRAVTEAFLKAGLTVDDALRQARLARILRWRDWDSENRKPILWTP